MTRCLRIAAACLALAASASADSVGILDFAGWDVEALKPGEWVTQETRRTHVDGAGKPRETVVFERFACVAATGTDTTVEWSTLDGPDGKATQVVVLVLDPESREVRKAWKSTGGGTAEAMTVDPPRKDDQMAIGLREVAEKDCRAEEFAIAGRRIASLKIGLSGKTLVLTRNAEFKVSLRLSAEIPFRTRPDSVQTVCGFLALSAWEDWPDRAMAIVELDAAFDGWTEMRRVRGWGTDARATVDVTGAETVTPR